MRAIRVRHLTSQDWTQRDSVVQERIQQGDYSTTVVRRCTYRIASQTVLPSQEDVVKWAQNIDPVIPRRVFVRKAVDPESGRERVDYKVIGHLYAVLESTVFCISYRHVLSMDVEELKSGSLCA
jgi:hypothetical protein